MQLLSWYSVLYGGTTAKGRVIWTGSMIDLLKGSVGGAGGSWGPCCIWCLSTLSGIKEGGGRLAVGEGTGRREKVEEGRGRRKRRQRRKRSWTKRKRFRALCCNLQRKLSIDFWLTTQRFSTKFSSVLVLHVIQLTIILQKRLKKCFSPQGKEVLFHIYQPSSFPKAQLIAC